MHKWCGQERNGRDFTFLHREHGLCGKETIYWWWKPKSFKQINRFINCQSHSDLHIGFFSVTYHLFNSTNKIKYHEINGYCFSDFVLTCKIQHTVQSFIYLPRLFVLHLYLYPTNKNSIYLFHINKPLHNPTAVNYFLYNGSYFPSHTNGIKYCICFLNIYPLNLVILFYLEKWHILYQFTTINCIYFITVFSHLIAHSIVRRLCSQHNHGFIRRRLSQ